MWRSLKFSSLGFLLVAGPTRQAKFADLDSSEMEAQTRSSSESAKFCSLNLLKSRNCQDFATRHIRVIKQRFYYTRKFIVHQWRRYIRELDQGPIPQHGNVIMLFQASGSDTRVIDIVEM